MERRIEAERVIAVVAAVAEEHRLLGVTSAAIVTDVVFQWIHKAYFQT